MIIQKETVSVMCDVCGRSYRSESIEAQEFVFIRHLGGYMSIFGDGEEIECDICQDCLLEKLGNYLRGSSGVGEGVK